MQHIPRIHLSATLAGVLAFALSASEALAFPSYGGSVDAACQSFNGTTPYADQGCALCHVDDRAVRVDPEWTWWESNDLTQFCPDVAPNEPPNGVIDSPVSNVTINAGEAVTFQATGTDPNGDVPLSYHWSFGGAAPDSSAEDPGNVVFANAGQYTVTLTVTDSLGAQDLTPDSRIITVEHIVTCTDADGDGVSPEGGTCGPIDCNDNDAEIFPGATEICTDGLDNDCDTLVDEEDPNAIECPPATVCMDTDADLFSPEGGLCGPIDCDDFDPSVNPGAHEACEDNVDNDCDGLIDSADRECNGGDCIEAHFSLPIDVAVWRARREVLLVRGSVDEGHQVVVLRDADSGRELGTTETRRDGVWGFYLRQLEFVPCRIRVEIGSRFGEKEVASAPDNCGVGTSPNSPPGCFIDLPMDDLTVTVGQSVTFAGGGSDPENDLPFTFLWDFDGAVPSTTAEDPGPVAFNTAGTFTVSFSVTDNQGLICAPIATRIVTVRERNPEDDFTAHPISAGYVGDGHEYDWRQRSDFCMSCHGSDLNGTSASATFAARIWESRIQQPDGTWLKRYQTGDIVGCADCHRKPGSGYETDGGYGEEHESDEYDEHEDDHREPGSRYGEEHEDDEYDEHED